MSISYRCHARKVHVYMLLEHIVPQTQFLYTFLALCYDLLEHLSEHVVFNKHRFFICCSVNMLVFVFVKKIAITSMEKKDNSLNIDHNYNIFCFILLMTVDDQWSMFLNKKKYPLHPQWNFWWPQKWYKFVAIVPKLISVCDNNTNIIWLWQKPQKMI